VPLTQPNMTVDQRGAERGWHRRDEAGGVRRQRVSGFAGPFVPGRRPCAAVVRGENSARDGVTEGGKGRSDSPLPSQAQHIADHTRPKSMWSRETKRSWAVMELIEQYKRRRVNQCSDDGPALKDRRWPAPPPH